MPLTRNDVFCRVVVDHVMPDAARVSWTVSPHFTEPGAWEFQLQTSESGEVTDTEWVDVGLPVSGSFAVDGTRHRTSKGLTTAYRVLLQIGDDSWASPPAMAYGLLSPREWLLARAELRRQLLRHRLRDAVDGWLFKRRTSGTSTATAPAWGDRATDPLTGLVLNSRHPATVGTEYAGGYYPGTPLRMIFTNSMNALSRDPERGQTNDGALMGECIAFPGLETRDVWVAKHDDRRYYINPKETIAELRQVPLLVRSELSPAPVGDPIYALEIP